MWLWLQLFVGISLAEISYYEDDRRIRTVRTAGRVYSTSWSRDGKSVASASLMNQTNEQLLVWNMSALSHIQQTPILQFRPWSVAWRDNLIAVGTREGYVLLVSSDGTIINHLPDVHTGRVNAMAWVADGSLFISGAYDGKVGVWNQTHLVYLLTHSSGAHPAAVQSVDCALTGFLCLSASKDGTIILLDARAGEIIRTYSGHSAMVNQVSWNSDGTKFASVSDDATLRIWDLETASDYATTLEGEVQSVDWCTDGRLAVGGGRGWVLVWAPHAPLPHIKLQTLGQTTVFSCQWSPDCQRLSVGDSGTLTLWDVSSGPLLRSNGKAGDLMVAIAWANNITAAMYEGGLVNTRDSQTWDLLASPSSIGCDIAWKLLRWSPDLLHLAYGSCNSVLVIWNAESNQTLCELEHEAPLGAIDWSIDSHFLATGTSDGEVTIWNPLTCEMLAKKWLHKEQLRVVKWSLDGKLCASASEDGAVFVWDINGAVVFSSNMSVPMVQALAWRDNVTLAIGFSEGVLLWNITGASELFISQQIVTAIAWSPLRTLLAVGDGSGSVHVWNVAIKSARILVGHTEDILDLCWSDNGTQLISAARDGVVMTWLQSKFDQWWVSNEAPLAPLVGPAFRLHITGLTLRPGGFGQLQTVDQGAVEWSTFETQGNSTALTAVITGFKYRVYRLRLYSADCSPPWALALDFLPRCPDFAVAVGEVCVCLPTYYSIDEFTQNCNPCPPTANCSNLNTTLGTLQAATGFWRDSQGRMPFTKCSGDACIEGHCAHGYQGPVCGSCALGFAQAGFNVCKACPKPLPNMLWLLLCGVLICSVIGAQVVLALRSDRSKAAWALLASIGLSAAQVNAMLLNLDVRLPSRAEALVRGQGTIQGAASALYSFSCLARHLGWKSESIFYLKYQLSALLPILAFIVVGLIRLIWHHCWVRCNNENQQHQPPRENRGNSFGSPNNNKRVPFVAGVIVLFTLYPSLCSQTFQLLSCRQVENQWRLSSDLSVICYTGKYWFIFGCVGVPVLTLYIALAPPLAIRRLLKPDGADVLGFLSDGFQYRWWFLVIIMRKLFLAALSCFLSWHQTPVQLLLCVICLLIFLLLHMHHQPFIYNAANMAESASITISCITYICAILVYDSPITDEYGTVLLVLLVGIYLVIAGFIFFPAKQLGKVRDRLVSVSASIRKLSIANGTSTDSVLRTENRLSLQTAHPEEPLVGEDFDLLDDDDGTLRYSKHQRSR